MSGHGKNNLGPMIVGALGVVFGDIGTSPLYAIKEALGSHGGGVPVMADVLGVLSLIFWSLVIVITVKYVIFIMRADNRGEGGIMALAALALNAPHGGPHWRATIHVLAICGLALFFGDGVITPAISVLSAVEGLELATPLLKPVVVPVTIGILAGLFVFQRRGTGGVGALFGPVVGVWFLVLAILGIRGIVMNPQVLMALNPVHAIRYFLVHQGHAFFVLGAVFLSVTGAEALYADMGHFGRKPIQWAWLFLVFPSLCLNYFGQGALILGNPETLRNPFYLLAPDWGLYPLVALATAATVIASQAVISGAFSASRQAMQLGFLPRMEVIHTSEQEVGQIYVPTVNWVLLAAVIALVLGFKSSSNLAAAYGIAVTGAMAIDTTLAFGLVLRGMMGWGLTTTLAMTGFFLVFDLAFFGANSLKIPDGGWFPLVLGAVMFHLMATWKKGREWAMRAVMREEIPLRPFLHQFADNPTPRTPGTAVYMTAQGEVVPRPLVQNLQHHWTVHERVVILSIHILEIPRVEDERLTVENLGHGFLRVIARFGFAETPDLPQTLGQSPLFPEGFDVEETSFFLGHPTFIALTGKPGFSLWRMRLFLWMQRNAGSAAVWFRIPPHRVVEMGSRIIL